MNKKKLSGSENKKRRLEKDAAVRENTQDISPFLKKKGNNFISSCITLKTFKINIDTILVRTKTQFLLFLYKKAA